MKKITIKFYKFSLFVFFFNLWRDIPALPYIIKDKKSHIANPFLPILSCTIIYNTYRVNRLFKILYDISKLTKNKCHTSDNYVCLHKLVNLNFFKNLN